MGVFSYYIKRRTFFSDRRSNFIIDNGAMIAQAGPKAFATGQITLLKNSWCTQRFRADQVYVNWRD